MKLHELTAIKKLLIDQKSILESELLKNIKLTDCKNLIESLSPMDFSKRDSLLDFWTNIDKEIKSLISNLFFQIREIENKIEEQTKPFLFRGYTVNNELACMPMTAENERFSRIKMVVPEIKLKVIAVIAQKTIPQFACLELGPGDGQWTEYLVAADPLYLADINQEFIDSTVKRFPEPYRPRIRTYILNNDGNLSKLPQNQFGFVFAWDVFSFMPLDLCKEYLQNIFDVLKPGGTFLFNYNNCDEYENVRYVETGFKSWMTKSLLEKTVKELGFNIEKYDNHKTEHWIVIRKPGNLRTVKSMQALGKIIQF